MNADEKVFVGLGCFVVLIGTFALVFLLMVASKFL